jgi:4-hydroxythreonine-4-phosphate dehydrogenase
MMQQPAPLVNLAITTGEPAGVGPEVSVAAARQFLVEQSNVRITLLGDLNLLEVVGADHSDPFGSLQIQAVPLMAPAKPGVPNPHNAQYVINTLNEAIDGCMDRRFDAMVTAPIQKSVINLAGTPFTGHTEYLAKRCKVEHVVMMLCATLPSGFLKLRASKDFRVALATTHLPLQEVSAALTREYVTETIRIVHHDLRTKFGIPNPAIRVAGLNPHAGESGYLGREEIDGISPAIEFAKGLGINVSGPYPGDTMFDPGALEAVDVYISMYHDQGLAPFKFVTFGGGVNVTLGLPIIRTSVDHGTALDIAGKGLADSGSMLEALRLAYQLALNQKKV